MFKLNLFLLLILLSCSLVYSQDKPPAIEVSGNAEIKIEADIMEIFITVNVGMSDLQSAKNKNDESTRDVLLALKKLNVEDKDIITSGITTSKDYNTNTKVISYFASNEIKVKTSNISGYESIISELIKIDNVFITNTHLSSTKAIETRIKAREDALLAAKKKAEEMAGIYNMSVGKPILIQEGSGNYYPNPFNASTQNIGVSNLDMSQDLFKADLISVTASVKVIFLLVDK